MLQCKECGVETADYFVKEAAIDQWNTRADRKPIIVTDPDREAVLVAALEHYADPDIWRVANDHVSEGYADWYMPERQHAYEVAQKALKEYRGER